METQDESLTVGDEHFPGRVTVPEGGAEQGVLVVPGANHGPFGDVFDRFATAATEAGHVVARFETWTSHDDLDAKTGADFAAEIEAGVANLRERGCERVAVVGKSFGGRLVLEHAPHDVDRVVLWAPAVLCGEHEDLPSLTPAELSAVEAPTCILQGDEDEGLSVENAADLAAHLPAGEVVELPGEDHSFRTDEERVVAETLAAL